jgi:hypothetical protein
MAYQLTWGNVVAPSFWPPLAKILMAWPLELHKDLFLTPRIEVNVAGLICLSAIAFLTWRLFESRLICLVAATLGLFLPQRLILSVVPLSDVYGHVLVLFAAGFAAGWIRYARRFDLIAASSLLMLASAVRLEDWFINAVFGLYLAYYTFGRREVGIGTFVLSAALIVAFPLFWIGNSYLHLGSLDNLFVTSRQFVEYTGRDYLVALKNNVLYRVARDVALNPALTLGAVSALYSARHLPNVRTWAILFFVPVVLEGLDMLMTLSVPIGEGGRTNGLTALLLLPFSAFAVVSIAKRFMNAPLGQIAGICAIAYGLVIPLALETRFRLRMAAENDSTLSESDLSLGWYLRDLLRRDDRNVLIDAIGNLDYLNILVTANAPERFVLNVDADPLTTALYAHPSQRAGFFERHEASVIDTYLTDKFSGANGVDFDRLRSRSIGYVLARNKDYVEMLRASPKMRHLGDFPPWALFAAAGSD